MDDDVILTWSVTNWITVVLMVVLGFAALSLAAQGVHAVRRSRAEG